MTDKVVTQFWEEVVWGKLDYLVLDLPPRTADVPLTEIDKRIELFGESRGERWRRQPGLSSWDGCL